MRCWSAWAFSLSLKIHHYKCSQLWWIMNLHWTFIISFALCSVWWEEEWGHIAIKAWAHFKNSKHFPILLIFIKTNATYHFTHRKAIFWIERKKNQPIHNFFKANDYIVKLHKFLVNIQILYLHTLRMHLILDFKCCPIAKKPWHKSNIVSTIINPKY